MCEMVHSFVFVFCLSFRLTQYESKSLLEAFDMNSPLIALRLCFLDFNRLSTFTALFHGVRHYCCQRPCLCPQWHSFLSPDLQFLQKMINSIVWLKQEQSSSEFSPAVPNLSLPPHPPPCVMYIIVCVCEYLWKPNVDVMSSIALYFIEAGSLTEPGTCHFPLILLASLPLCPLSLPLECWGYIDSL